MNHQPTATRLDRPTPRWGVLLLVLLAVSTSGCAAFHPVRGVPAPYVPPEYLGPSRSGKKTIDLSLLVQTQPDQYRVAAGDTLSIYIPGVLGSLNVEEDRQIGETPPINISSNPADPPTIGYPMTVRDDGTIALPYIDPINVHGMTLPQIEKSVRHAFTVESNILHGERDRVLVSLQRRREVNVIVVRQETSSELTLGAQPGTLNVGNSKRGTARTVRLPAYENDVLHALANSQQGADGLPGLDAKNTIYIIRRKRKSLDHALDAMLPTGPAPVINHPVGPRPVPKLSWPDAAPADQPKVIPSTPQVKKPPATETASPPNQRRQIPSVELTIPRRSDPRVPSADRPVRIQPSVEPSTRLEAESSRAVEPAPAKAPTPVVPGATSKQDDPGQRPIWPAPANPAPSIQKMSGERADGLLNVWPQVRGQSPDQWGWGHSPGPAVGPPMMVEIPPYPRSGPQFPAGFGHGEPTSMPSGPGVPPRPPLYDHRHLDGHTAVGGHDDAWRNAFAGFDPTVDNPNVIKIPIRLAEGERPTFTERDIILEDGDIVFIESRETEVFYTGGLLGGGQYTLPRDYDLRVLEAISIAQSSQNSVQSSGRTIGGVSALNQDVTISASHVVILRSLPNGTRIPIEVDLYKAVRRPQENILIQPGDLVILQYTKFEAIGAFLERHLLEGALFGLATSQLTNPSNGN